MENLLKNPLVINLIDISFAEDIGEGDHTSLACIDKTEQGKSIIIAKENGVLAGIDLAEFIFKKVDPTLIIKKFFSEGALLNDKDIVMEISGSSQSMLTAERTVLNFIQRLSGIATSTKQYAEALLDFHTQIIDTRKTTPGMRLLEKWAVKIGGGKNHRIGLYDMILIKDNHIDFAGGIENAIDKTHEYLKSHNLNLQIEIETRSIEEVKKVLVKKGVHRIMLDNFTPSMISEAVLLINHEFETEASGGITLLTLKEYAKTGVDFISSGALTHSVKSFDFSMKAI
ncbi:MAG: carboxylating nicotinate-nucleotide diphosphorylase [Bacteroidota bacterium]